MKNIKIYQPKLNNFVENANTTHKQLTKIVSPNKSFIDQQKIQKSQSHQNTIRKVESSQKPIQMPLKRIVNLEKTLESLDTSKIIPQYSDFLQSLHQTHFDTLSNDKKLEYLIEYILQINTSHSIGALVFIFELIYKYNFKIEDTYIGFFLECLIKAFEETRDIELFIILEILSIIGPNKIIYDSIQTFVTIFIDAGSDLVRKAAFICLIQMDYPGLYALIDIANRDYSFLSNYIFDQLLSLKEIQVIFFLLINQSKM